MKTFWSIIPSGLVHGCEVDKSYLKWQEIHLAMHCREGTPNSYNYIVLWQTASLQLQAFWRYYTLNYSIIFYCKILQLLQENTCKTVFTGLQYPENALLANLSHFYKYYTFYVCVYSYIPQICRYILYMQLETNMDFFIFVAS